MTTMSSTTRTFHHHHRRHAKSTAAKNGIVRATLIVVTLHLITIATVAVLPTTTITAPYVIIFWDAGFVLALQQQPPITSFLRPQRQQKQPRLLLSELSSSSRSTTTSDITTTGKVKRISVGNQKNYTISQLGCGTWSWGNRLLWDYDISQDAAIYDAYRIIRNAGVTLFDTADSYGTLDLNGRAEILLGQFEKQYQNQLRLEHEEKQKREWWKFSSKSSNNNILKQRQQQVATKFAPYPWRITRGSIVQAATDSLQRLKQNKLAIAQLHWSTSKYQPFQEGAIWEGIADVYDANLCDGVGVSNYGPRQLMKVAQRMEERNVPLMVAQIQYSLLTYGVGQYMNAACDNVGCRLISYSPLCLGLLTGKYTLDNLPRPGNPRRQLFRELLPSAQGLLQTLDAISKEYDTTPSQIAIYWTISKGTVPIPGCRTVEQAISNVNAATTLQLPSDVLSELDHIALAIKKPMIQNIFQTK